MVFIQSEWTMQLSILVNRTHCCCIWYFFTKQFHDLGKAKYYSNIFINSISTLCCCLHKNVEFALEMLSICVPKHATYIYLFWKDKSIRIAFNFLFSFCSFSWQLFTFPEIWIEFKANILLGMVAASASASASTKWNCNKLFCVCFAWLKAFLLVGLKRLCQTDCQVRIVVQVLENFFHMKLLMLLLALTLSLSSISLWHMETEGDRERKIHNRKS